MRNMKKKIVSLAMVLIMVLTIVPATPIQAKKKVVEKKGTMVHIDKTAKEKNIIKKFDDQDMIDRFDEETGLAVSEYITLINECGGWKGITEEYTWKMDKKQGLYVQKYKEGVYLDPNSLSGIRPKYKEYGAMTKAQAARSLKNMYGKDSCVTKEDLKANDEPLSERWLLEMVEKISIKRYCSSYGRQWTRDMDERISTKAYLTKAGYALLMGLVIESSWGKMDPRSDQEFLTYDEVP